MVEVLGGCWLKLLVYLASMYLQLFLFDVFGSMFSQIVEDDKIQVLDVSLIGLHLI